MWSKYFLIWPNLKLFAFFGLSGLFLGLGSVSKTFLRLAYIDNQLWFWKYSHIFRFLFDHICGFLCTFLGPSWLFLWPFVALWGYICGRGQVEKHFLNLPM